MLKNLGTFSVDLNGQSRKWKPKVKIFWPSAAWFARPARTKKNISIMNAKTKQIIKIVATVTIAALSALLGVLGLSSCNVTRKITTEQSFFQRGDTTVQIVTRTTESYDASKKL